MNMSIYGRDYLKYLDGTPTFETKENEFETVTNKRNVELSIHMGEGVFIFWTY